MMSKGKEGTTTATPTIGSLRFAMDKRQIAGLLMVTGFAALIQPLAGIAASINGGPDGTTVTEGLAFSALFGSLCVVATGIMSILAGYAELFHDAGHKYITVFMFVFMQSAFIPYISGMTGVGKATVAGASFDASGMLDPPPNGSFIGAMAILGIFAYGFGLLGSVSFCQFSLYAFQAGKPHERDGTYYRGRLLFYSFILFVAGLSQLLLGAYLQSQYGSDLAPGVVTVAFYVVRYPPLAIVVGTLQIINAVWGVLRNRGVMAGGGAFQVSIWFGWLVQIALQVLTQPGSLPGGMAAPNAPTVAAFAFGLNLMPAFLDSRATALESKLSPEYYGLAPAAEEEEGTDDRPEAALTAEGDEEQAQDELSF